MNKLLPLLIVFLSFNVLSQDMGSEVTEAQVSDYQRGIEAGCKDQGRGKGDPTEMVDAVCRCIVKVLKEEMPFTDWQKAYFFSRSRNGREEMRVLAPHTKKTQVCRANAP